MKKELTCLKDHLTSAFKKEFYYIERLLNPLNDNQIKSAIDS